MNSTMRQSMAYLTMAAFFCVMSISLLAAVIGKIALIVYLLTVEWPQFKQSIRSTMINLVLPLVGLISVVPIAAHFNGTIFKDGFLSTFPFFSWPVSQEYLSFHFPNPLALLLILDGARVISFLCAIAVLIMQSIVVFFRPSFPQKLYEYMSLALRGIVLFGVLYYITLSLSSNPLSIRKIFSCILLSILITRLSQQREKYFEALKLRHGVMHTGHLLYGYGVLDTLISVLGIGYLGIALMCMVIIISIVAWIV